jgi:hypothetical protein
MTPEWSIPALKQTSTNLPFFEACLRRHLDGIGELRVIQSSYRLPLKEVVTQELNPQWVDPDVVSTSQAQQASISQTQQVSSSQAQQAPTSQTPQVLSPVQAVPKWLVNSTYISNDLVDTFSPGLDRAGGPKTLPYAILNNQCISLFSRLLDRSLHHLLVYNKAINPHRASAAVFKATKAHLSCSSWMATDALTRRWEAIRVCIDPEVTYNELLALN